MEGLLVIDKPPDMTSHDVVSRVRHILHERRIGHTGTLDPFATGVLLILIGRVTRLARFLKADDKEYDAIIRLGYATSTGDKTGTPLTEVAELKLHALSEGAIEAALAKLRGEIDQVPPMYSAKKIQGHKLYELARRGEIVARKPVRVCINDFTPIRADGQLVRNNVDGTYDFRARIVCSSGTYVRSLAEDFGKHFHVGAHLAELRRIRVGAFTIESAITLEELQSRFVEEALGTVLVPPASALSNLPFVHLKNSDVRKVRHGMEVGVSRADWADDAEIRILDEYGNLLAVGKYDATQKRLHPHVVLAPID